jgi:regulator of nucleoside diphosphate kinase
MEKKEKKPILLDEDVENLQGLLDSCNKSISQYCNSLKEELRKAVAVPKIDLPPDVVIMNSSALVFDEDAGESVLYTLVYPWDADSDENRISILAPVGTALLGNRKGDSINWKVPAGMRRLKIMSVRQPN